MKRLYRIKSQGKIGGVCAGLGEYLEVDPTIIRLIFILLLFSGPGFLIYLVMWIAFPDISAENADPATTISQNSEEIPERTWKLSDSLNTSRSGVWIGLILIIFGGLLLLRNFGIDWFYWMRWIRFRTFWPLVLVGLGILILFQNNRNKN